MNAIDGWVTKPLGAVIKGIGDGGTPNTNKNEYFGGSIPWAVIQDIKKDISETKTTLTQLGLDSCSAKLWPAGSVILSTGATIGEVGIAKVPLATKQGIHGIVCGEELSSSFLYYKLQTLRDFLNANAQGSTIREVRATFIRTIPITFPTELSEQAKIVEILSTVARVIEQTEALIAKQQRIKTGLMQDLLTRGIDEHGNIRSEETHEFKDSPLGRIPVEWEITKLSSFVARLDAGVSVNSEDKPCGAGQIGVLKTSALHKGRFFPDQNKTVIEAEEARVKVSPRIGTVLISRMNTPELVGESCYVNQNCPYLFLPDRIWMTVFHKRKEQVGKWLSFVLISHHARSYITLHATGTSGSMKSIPKKILLEMPLCAPRKITELVQIGHELEKYESVMDQIDVCLNKLRRLKTALMQDLLTGKVPVTPLLSEPEVAST